MDRTENVQVPKGLPDPGNPPIRSFRPRAPKYSYLVSTHPSSSKSLVGQGSSSSSYLFGKSDLSSTSSMANLPLASSASSSSQYDAGGRSHKFDDMEIYSTFRSTASSTTHVSLGLVRLLISNPLGKNKVIGTPEPLKIVLLNPSPDRPKPTNPSISSVSRSSYNLPQSPQSPKLSSAALLEKYGAAGSSGLPPPTSSSMSSSHYGGIDSGVKKSMSFSNFGSVRAGAENALQVGMQNKRPGGHSWVLGFHSRSQSTHITYGHSSIMQH